MAANVRDTPGHGRDPSRPEPAETPIPSELADVLGPDLYRRNPFRLSGLRVDASSREIRRHADQLRRMARLDSDAAGVETVLTSLQGLRDPVRRIVDELFWIWPVPEDDPLAVHNLAVHAHSDVLDTEHLSGTGDVDHWLAAYSCWRQVVDADECWEWLDGRIRALDDPRLTPGFAVLLRESLPRALLGVQATLAVRAAEAGDVERAEWHTDVMYDSAFQADATDALVTAVRPIATRIRAAAVRAEDQLNGDRRQCAAVGMALLDETEPLLDVLEVTIGSQDPLYAGAADAVARAANLCAVAYADSAKDSSQPWDLLARVRMIGGTDHTVELITENLGVFATNTVGEQVKLALDQLRADPNRATADLVELIANLSAKVERLPGLGVDSDTYEKLRSLLQTAAEVLNSPVHSAIAVTGLALGADDVARCWFCLQVAVNSSGLERSMYGEVNHEWDRCTWKTLTVTVPRCRNCELVHSGYQREASRRLGAGRTALVIVLAVVGLVALPWTAICWIGVAWLVIGSHLRRRNSRNSFMAFVVYRAFRYPPIEELQRQGWRFGDRPEGV